MLSIAPIDLSKEDDVARLVDGAIEAFGGFDILYNNAAGTRTGTIETQSREDFDFTLTHELTIIFLTVKQSLPVFKGRGGGAIINTGSVAGIVGDGAGNTNGLLSHCVGKAGVIRMTQHMAVELSPHNIRVNAVSPGIVHTPAVAPFLADGVVRDAYMRHLLIRRLGAPEDIANAALFLASDEASYITGTNLIVDGGWAASGGPDVQTPPWQKRSTPLLLICWLVATAAQVGEPAGLRADCNKSRAVELVGDGRGLAPPADLPRALVNWMRSIREFSKRCGLTGLEVSPT